MPKRNYKGGVNRQQGFLLPPNVNEYVSQDNSVRAIDAYVDSLVLSKLGFKNAKGELTAGQPAFPPACLLKLYLYGYLHRVHSSRGLAVECERNLEVIWLMAGLKPGYKTIADFRKDNLPALKQINRDFVQLCKELDLFGKELVGIDGSFFRGNVSKRNIYTVARLKNTLEHIEKDITRYLEDLEKADHQEENTPQADPKLAEKLERLLYLQQKRQAQLEQLKASEQTQIADVDEDARLLSKKGIGTIAGYNVQVAVDEKHALIVIGDVVQDGNDEKQLAPMGKAAKAELEVETLQTVQDQGYYNAQQIKACEEVGITPYVPEPDKQRQVRAQGRFGRDAFSYDAQANVYLCPGGQELHFTLTNYKGGKAIHHYHSRTATCRQCPLKDRCLPKATKYRTVTRWEHEEWIEKHRKRMAVQGAEMMRRRTALCEHPFGTLKRWCGINHFLLRGLEKVRAEFSLMMLVYNFKRVLSLIGLEAFRSYCLQRT